MIPRDSRGGFSVEKGFNFGGIAGRMRDDTIARVIFKSKTLLLIYFPTHEPDLEATYSRVIPT